jgi:hypothetical protein
MSDGISEVRTNVKRDVLWKEKRPTIEKETYYRRRSGCRTAFLRYAQMSYYGRKRDLLTKLNSETYHGRKRDLLTFHGRKRDLLIKLNSLRKRDLLTELNSLNPRP